MFSLRSITRGLRSLWQRNQVDRELEQEIGEFFEMAVAEKVRQGASRPEAIRAVRRERGSQTTAKEIVRTSGWESVVETTGQDVRLAVRVLAKSPGFTIVAIVTLALSIGANAVVFSITNALIVRPLDVPDAASFYGIERGPDKAGSQSYPDYRDLRDRNRSFADLVAYDVGPAGLDAGDNPSRAWVELLSGNYFDALHLTPFIGRVFHAADERGPNSAPYVVLSYGYWHSHFQDDRGVVGRSVLVNKHPFTIIGVTQPAFHGTIVFFNPDFFIPLVDEEQIKGMNDLETRSMRSLFMVMGHLKPGVTPAQAAADLSAIGADLEKAYPKDDSHMTFTLARPGWYGDYLGPPVHAFLTGLTLLAGLILLAACANLGSLYAARAVDRSREIALRLALGSSRSRITRQMFTEAILISLVGGALGLLGSVALLRGLSNWRPLPMFPIHVPLNPDANVYLIALALTIASGLCFGAVPLREMLRTNPYAVIKSGSNGGIGRRITVRDALLVGQVAICAVLVTSSMVAVRGLVRSLHGHYGFDPVDRTMVETDLTMSGYRGDQIPAVQRRMLDAVQRIPGVMAVGLADKMPLGSDGGNRTVIYSDTATELTSARASGSAMVYRVSPEYPRTAGTTLLAGRMLTWHDDLGAPRVAMINAQFARQQFGSVDNATGRYFKLRDGTRLQVVGVVEDGKYETLTEALRPAMFFPFLQTPSPSTFLVVRSTRDPAQLALAVRGALHDVDGSLPLEIRTWYADLDNAFFPAHVAALALGVLGLMGAMLSITGIFGMAAHSVSRRLKELGIRIAVGAQRRDVLQAALGRTFKVLTIGSAAGLLMGVLASRILAFIVYQATPRDPLVLGSVVLAMLLLGVFATWMPARRALSVDPLVLLREQ